MTVGNCVFGCMYDLYVYFSVPVSFGDCYLAAFAVGWLFHVLFKTIKFSYKSSYS